VARSVTGGVPRPLRHQGRLCPVGFWIFIGMLLIVAGWTIGTGTFAFREDVLAGLVARQAEMQFGYEDRIAELRAQLDRLSSRQVLDQNEYQQKLHEIMRRQATLESRTSALDGLGEAVGSTRQSARASATGEPRPRRAKPSPISNKGAFALPRGHQSSVHNRAAFALSAADPSTALARLQASLDLVEQRQVTALSTIEDSYDQKARRIRGVLAELDVGLGKSPLANPTGAAGGPFVPVRVAQDSEPFERRVHRINVARTQVHRLVRTLNAIPLRNPLDGEAELSSGFGIRNDPFNGSPAMHTGLDLLGDPGDAVRATANGTVATAGWSGGYGKTVDLDHGNAISTRYGHLSSIDVRVGQFVKAGQVIGKVGSTGRSTGPHLHYETRMRREAVDPQKFLHAGRKLADTL
jgi:murein DD-endopeptidase MepM/ murein hydrolase activator NlpD